MCGWGSQGHGGSEERIGEGAAPAKDSGHRCHLALTQGESGNYSLTGGGWGA